jgi:phosphatidylglycerophosphatase A
MVKYRQPIMKRLLTSCFGLGFLPGAPGTFGSLPPPVVFVVMTCSGAEAATISIVMTAFVIAGSIICVSFSPAIIDQTGKSDPGQIVIDEFAGQAVTFIGLPVVSADKTFIITAVLGFLLFRFFDILKPWPIRKLEKLPKGWGILADDLMAGLFALIVLHVSVKLWLVG